MAFMQRNGLILIPILALAFLSGCNAVSERECLQADWYNTGFADGQKGFPEDRVNEISKACGEYNVGIERERYLTGREAGLGNYCQLRPIFNAGIRGGRYYGVCQDYANAGELVEAWSLGRELYFIDREIYRLEDEIRQIQDDLFYACRLRKDCYYDYANTRGYRYQTDRLRFRILDLQRQRDTARRRADARLRELELAARGSSAN